MLCIHFFQWRGTETKLRDERRVEKKLKEGKGSDETMHFMPFGTVAFPPRNDAFCRDFNKIIFFIVSIECVRRGTKIVKDFSDQNLITKQVFLTSHS